MAATASSPATGRCLAPIGHEQAEGHEVLGEQALTGWTPLVSEVPMAALNVSTSPELWTSGPPCYPAEMPGHKNQLRLTGDVPSSMKPSSSAVMRCVTVGHLGWSV